MSLLSTSHATCYDFGCRVHSFEIELPIYEIILSAEGSKGGCHLSFYQSENRCHVSGQILTLTTSHSFLSHSLAFVLVANDLAEGTAFAKTGCLQ